MNLFLENFMHFLRFDVFENSEKNSCVLVQTFIIKVSNCQMS